MSDEALGELCLKQLSGLLLQATAANYLGCRVLRTATAYPVFLNSYEAERLALTKSTGVPNLLSIGRHGEFAHILMEDIYWRTQAKMRSLVNWLKADGVPLAA